MKVTEKALVEAKELETTLTDQYEAVSLTARINAATATNNSASVRTISVHLVGNGDTADATNRLIPARALGIGESYTCPEICMHALNAGGKISAVASGAGVTFAVSGVEIVG
jgi:hypothetical protein